jgi:CDP-glucose 4,6-dehydratase
MEKGLSSRYEGRRVWVTGHTGFKGAWLCEWLLQMGAEVFGYALEPETEPALFVQLGLADRIRHRIGDVRNSQEVRRALEEAAPDFVFHLAAQPLVRRSYQRPVETFETNVLGTIHVLDALRGFGRQCSAVMVTTDKCYENEESGRSYREDDRLGGHDPYSSSKAMAELAVASYRRSFMDLAGSLVRVATARAGNVIGGGDWAEDRIVPDSIRALQAGKPVGVRNPASTRPWQHVLEPLSGYLALAAALDAGSEGVPRAVNFGPLPDSSRPVRDLVAGILKSWKGGWQDLSEQGAVHEARLLSLDIGLAERSLGWEPVWDFDRTVQETVDWYHCVHGAPEAASVLTRQQIQSYTAAAESKGLTWARRG